MLAEIGKAGSAHVNLDLNKNGKREDHDIESMKILAKRYAFLLSERYQLPFKFFYEPSHTDFRAMSFESLSALSDHPEIQLIVNRIEDKGEFLLPADANAICESEV